jgi:hypothetical protein
MSFRELHSHTIYKITPENVIVDHLSDNSHITTKQANSALQPDLTLVTILEQVLVTVS